LAPATPAPWGSVTLPAILPYTACPAAFGALKPQAKHKITNTTQIDRLTITSSFEKRNYRQTGRPWKLSKIALQLLGLKIMS
jgi:hypothetical protein